MTLCECSLSTLCYDIHSVTVYTLLRYTTVYTLCYSSVYSTTVYIHSTTNTPSLSHWTHKPCHKHALALQTTSIPGPPSVCVSTRWSPPPFAVPASTTIPSSIPSSSSASSSTPSAMSVTRMLISSPSLPSSSTYTLRQRISCDPRG